MKIITNKERELLSSFLGSEYEYDYIDYNNVMIFIEKIENTFIDDIQLSTEIEGNYCVVLGTNVYCEGEDKLDAIFKTVIKFIIYFNKINKI